MSDIEPGIYFGLDEAVYHATPALSSSGIKNLRISTLDYWARCPWLNPNFEEENEEAGDSFARILGRAYHKRILEGREAFVSCYAPSFEPAWHEDALEGSDDIKSALRRHKEAGADVKLTGNKSELIERLLEIDATAKIMDVLKETYTDHHAGKEFLPQRTLDKIELAAAMIEKHPTLSKAFSGGAAEVSIIWDCPVIGVRCKARLDYLKPRAISDLKTFANPQGKPIPVALNRELAFRKYHVQAAMYDEAARFIPGFLKEGRVFGEAPADLLKGLARGDDKTFLFVFQAKGVAPLAIGRTLQRESMIFRIGQSEVEGAKQTLRLCTEKFGTDPWVEDSEIKAFDDSEIPTYALE